MTQRKHQLLLAWAAIILSVLAFACWIIVAIGMYYYGK